MLAFALVSVMSPFVSSAAYLISGLRYDLSSCLPLVYSSTTPHYAHYWNDNGASALGVGIPDGHLVWYAWHLAGTCRCILPVVMSGCPASAPSFPSFYQQQLGEKNCTMLAYRTGFSPTPTKPSDACFYSPNSDTHTISLKCSLTFPCEILLIFAIIRNTVNLNTQCTTHFVVLLFV